MPASPQLCPPSPIASRDFACLLRGGSLGLDAVARRRQQRSWLASALAQALLAVAVAGALHAVPPIAVRSTPVTLTWLVVPPTVAPPPHLYLVAPRARVYRTLRPSVAVPHARPRPRIERLRPMAVPAPPAPRLDRPPAAFAPEPEPAPAPAAKVELGRFGARSGLAPQPGAAVAAPELGNFGVAATPDPPAAAAPAVALAGFGNGSGAGPSASAGDGDEAIHRAGFGAASSSSSSGEATPGAVAVGGFAPTPAPRLELDPTPVASGFSPPEILAWPTPAYTPAAAAHHIQGEVVLAVRLAADGHAQVIRVVHSLGFGLDDAARAAATALQFRPARRNGAAVNWTVRVHIQFRLAY